MKLLLVLILILGLISSLTNASDANDDDTAVGDDCLQSCQQAYLGCLSDSADARQACACGTRVIQCEIDNNCSSAEDFAMVMALWHYENCTCVLP